MEKRGKSIVIKCPSCGFENEFDQPHIYHAGHSDCGFLYNEPGNRTLIWSSFDPDYEAVVGPHHPWMLTTEKQKKLEDLLKPDAGGKWLFSNPARCLRCHYPISSPIGVTINFLKYEGSIDLDSPGRSMREMFKSETG
jgi:hypothetical protein